MIIYIVRHGQTDWNAAKRIQGQTDTQMTALGRQQAERNGRTLAGLLPNPVEFDFVASPLSRARETMKILREALGLAVDDFATDDRLKEINHGEFVGESWDSLRAKGRGQELDARMADPWHFTPAGGESYKALSARVLECFNSLETDSVVAAHGGIQRVIRGHVENLPKEQIPSLPVPQDKIMAVEYGKIDWI